MPCSVRLAPSALVCSSASVQGDVVVGDGSVVHPHCVLDGTRGPIIIGCNCIVQEAVLVRSSDEYSRHCLSLLSACFHHSLMFRFHFSTCIRRVSTSACYFSTTTIWIYFTIYCSTFGGLTMFAVCLHTDANFDNRTSPNLLFVVTIMNLLAGKEYPSRTIAWLKSTAKCSPRRIWDYRD